VVRREQQTLKISASFARGNLKNARGDPFPTSGARGYYIRLIEDGSSFTKQEIDFWRLAMDVL